MSRKRYQSIMQADTDRCYISGRTDALEWHHVYGSANKKHSEKYGLMVRLNHQYHNEPPMGVHHNKQMREHLCREGQKLFEEIHGSRNDFICIFGRSYL